jgi:hypothetical protein
VVELRLGPQEDGALLAEVLLGQGPSLEPPPRWGRPASICRLDRQVAAVGVAQEDQAHDGHEVLVAGQAGVGAQEVGGAPQALFDGFDGSGVGSWGSVWIDVECRDCRQQSG